MLIFKLNQNLKTGDNRDKGHKRKLNEHSFDLGWKISSTR